MPGSKYTKFDAIRPSPDVFASVDAEPDPDPEPVVEVAVKTKVNFNSIDVCPGHNSSDATIDRS